MNGFVLPFPAADNSAIAEKGVGKTAEGLAHGAAEKFTAESRGIDKQVSLNPLTFVRYQSLYFNTTGDRNTAIGSSVLVNNTTGYRNTGNGSFALYYNTSGFYNTATGYGALYRNTTGNYNTVIGSFALYTLLTALLA